MERIESGKIDMTYSDTDLIKAITNGAPELFEILIRRNNAFLYKVGRSYGYHHEDTQDLMQETFIDAYYSLSKFEYRSSFKTWIIKIMMNNCFRRKQKFSVRNEMANAISEKSTPMFINRLQGDTDHTVVNAELHRVIENALSRVPLDYRMVFSMREINGLNVAETADALNISESNVKVRHNRAKALLRKEIERTYTPEDIFEFNLVYCDAMVSRVMSQLGKKPTY